MNFICTIVTVQETIVKAIVGLLPFWILVTVIIWVFRLVRSLRDRLDSIEDKLELLVLAQQLESTQKKSVNKPDSQTEKPSA